MTVEHLQNIVCRLANSGYCRYWVSWSGSEHPIMAVQCLSPSDMKPSKIHDAEARGLTENRAPGMDDWIYTVPRTNEDGTPYQSKFE